MTRKVYLKKVTIAKVAQTGMLIESTMRTSVTKPAEIATLEFWMKSGTIAPFSLDAFSTIDPTEGDKATFNTEMIKPYVEAIWI